MSYIYEDCYRYRSNGTVAAGVVVPLFTDLACTTPASPSSVTTDADGFGLFSSATWPVYYKVSGDSEGHRALCVNPPGVSGGIGGVFDVTNYGADSSGATDSTADIAATIAEAQANGGVVWLPGTFAISPTAGVCLTIPSQVTLAGMGRQASTLVQTGNGVMLDFSGPSNGNWNVEQGLRDITLDGQSTTGPLMRMYYSGFFSLYDVILKGNLDVALSGVALQDSRFYNLYIEFCGALSGTAAPAIQLLSSVAASGFGHSTTACNSLHFFGLDIENCYSGGVDIGLGVGSANHWDINFTGIKVESQQIAVNQPFINITDGIDISLRDVYLSADSYRGGYSTPPDGLYFCPNSGTLETVLISSGSAGFNRGVYCWGGSNTDIADICGSYVTVPSVAHFACGGNGSSGTIHLRNISTNTGTLFSSASGYPGDFDYIQPNVMVVPYASAITPDPIAAEGHNVGALTGDITINNPAHSWMAANLIIVLLQDGSGNHNVTFGNNYKTVGTILKTASTRTVIQFVYDGSYWVQTALSTGV